jgi:hypothetical protein
VRGKPPRTDGSSSSSAVQFGQTRLGRHDARARPISPRARQQLEPLRRLYALILAGSAWLRQIRNIAFSSLLFIGCIAEIPFERRRGKTTSSG